MARYTDVDVDVTGVDTEVVRSNARYNLRNIEKISYANTTLSRRVKWTTRKRKQQPKKMSRYNLRKRETNNDYYPVEYILDRRGVAKHYFYLVKWEGYSTTTWEPQSHITEDLIKSYNGNIEWNK